MTVRRFSILLGVAALLVAGAVWAAPVAGPTLQLYTVDGFVESLIGRGIIPATYADRARTFAKLFSKVHPEAQSVQARNADKVSVAVSQLIQHANLEFSTGGDIEGLLLLAKNTSDQAIVLEAKRGCQVLYRIYDEEGTLVYDSATRDVCVNTEEVTYVLDAGKTRMFPVTHKDADHALAPGTYRFELEYPGYGQGELTVTVAGS